MTLSVTFRIENERGTRGIDRISHVTILAHSYPRSQISEEITTRCNFMIPVTNSYGQMEELNLNLMMYIEDGKAAQCIENFKRMSVYYPILKCED